MTVGLLKDVTYLCPYMGSVSGKLIITTYKLYFSGQSPADKVYILSHHVLYFMLL